MKLNKLLTQSKIFAILMLFCISIGFGQTNTSGNAYIWNTTSSWIGGVVPGAATTVNVNHPLTLDNNLSIGTGNYTINQDVTDQPGNTAFNLSAINASGSLTIVSGTTTIEGVTSIGGNSVFTLTVKAGATLILGTIGSTSDNFLIGNKTNINIEAGGTIIVFGNIKNSNSTGTFAVNGLLMVYGDYITDNGNIDISGTTGQFYTTGAMTTQGSSSQIYGSSNNCTSNCSGTSLGCGGTSGGIAYTATITPQSQTVCSGGAIAQMTFTTNAPSPTYEWQYSLTAGGTYTPISGATSTTYTPSGLTKTTWYRVKYTSSDCGPKYSAPVPVYISASTFTQSTAGQTVCSGSFGPISVTAYGTGLIYQWYSNTSASNSGGLAISGATSNIYTPTNTVSGTKYYYCVINSSCGTPFTSAISGAFTVSSPSAPTIGTITQPTCTLTTGSVILNSLPTSGSWTLYQNGASIYTLTGGTGTYTVSGLAAGTYNFTVSNGTCTSAASTNVVINAVVTTTYNGSSWSSTPDLTKIGIINSNTPITVSADLCSCTVNAGVNAVVASGVTLKLQDKLTVSSTGTLTFQDSASLVQINNVTNSGNITYKRYANIRNTDYTYWSSPVDEYTLGGVSRNETLSDKYYSYNSLIDNWQQESAATEMKPGLGYIIRGPEPTSTPPLPPPPGIYEAPFVGVPNNGNIQVEVTYANSLGLPSTDPNFGVSYLLGNPYPSALDAETFLDINSGVLGGTIYFWTHNTALDLAANITNPGPGWAYTYSLNDYAAYNAVGGVGVGSGTAATSGGLIPNGKIASGQGFFATGIATGTVNFTNAMRLAGTMNSDGTGTNQQFFKTKNPNIKTAKTIEKNRVWLNLSNAQGAFKQTLIGYVTDASNDYDSRFDGESFDGNEFVDFYSVNQDKNLTIQGRALPFDENDEVPLGYRTTINGEFTINFDQVDGSLTNQAVFIEDKLTNKTVNLKEGNYTFNTAAGTFNDRFVLRYTNKTLGKEEVELNDGIIALYSNNYKTLIIRNNVNDATVNAVELFNLLGQKITNWEVEDSEQINIQIPIKNTSSGIYIVKIKTTKGEFSKKIIIK